MQDWALSRFQPITRFSQQRSSPIKQGALGNLVRDDLAVVYVHHWRQVEFLAANVEFRHIRYPFLVRIVRLELALEDIRRGATDFAPVGAVLLLSDARLQLQCSHETLHGFVIDQLAFLTYHSRDTAVAILALMNLENPAHSPFETRRLVRHLQRLLRIVKGAACEAGHLEQASEWILLPQLKHDLRSLSCAACFFV